MRSLRVVTRLSGVALLLCVTSCVESRSPLSNPSTCTPDEDIIGLWVSENQDGSRRVVLVGKKNTMDLVGSPNGIMCMGYADFDKNGHLISTEATNTFFVSTIGTEKFMNRFKLGEATKQITTPDKKVVKVWNPEGVKEYTLFKYEATKDKLVIWRGDPNQRALATLIDNGKLLGSVTWDDKKEYPTKLELTDSTEGLTKFLLGGGSAQLFPDKVRLPDTKEEIRCKVEYRRLTLPAK